jgi:hypothetical protein
VCWCKNKETIPKSILKCIVSSFKKTCLISTVGALKVFHHSNRHDWLHVRFDTFRANFLRHFYHSNCVNVLYIFNMCHQIILSVIHFHYKLFTVREIFVKLFRNINKAILI